MSLLENKTVLYKNVKGQKTARQKGYSLFDLESDPFELVNLADSRLNPFQISLIIKINNYVMDKLGNEFHYPLQGSNNKNWDVLLWKIFRGMKGKRLDKMKKYLKESGRLTSNDCWGLNALENSTNIDFAYLKRFYDNEARPAERNLIKLTVKTTPYFNDFTSLL